MNDHVITSIPEQGKKKMWGCENQEELLPPRCKRRRQPTDVQGRGSFRVPTVLFLPQKVDARKQWPTEPFHTVRSQARGSSNRGKSCRMPVLRRAPIVKADLWTGSVQENGSHNAGITQRITQHITHCSSPGHEMVYRQTSNSRDMAFRNHLCVERWWKRKIMERWVVQAAAQTWDM